MTESYLFGCEATIYPNDPNRKTPAPPIGDSAIAFHEDQLDRARSQNPEIPGDIIQKLVDKGVLGEFKGGIIYPKQSPSSALVLRKQDP
jgi:hypothetical protein